MLGGMFCLEEMVSYISFWEWQGGGSFISDVYLQPEMLHWRMVCFITCRNNVAHVPVQHVCSITARCRSRRQRFLYYPIHRVSLSARPALRRIHGAHWAWSCSLCDSAVVHKLQKKSLSGVLFFITQRAWTLHISSAASPQVTPELSLHCLLALPTTRHHWHWLRCTKNLHMCGNYLCLMLRASVYSSALGAHYFCDGNSLRITDLHPIWSHCRKRRHRARRPLWIHGFILQLW